VNYFLKKENVPVLLLIIFYLFTRFFHLTILPIFNDESIYLYWAKLIEMTHAHLFISLTDGKPPLLIWVMAIFLKIFPPSAYLLAGRLPSVITGLISMLGIYALSHLLFHSKKTAILTAFLYIITPFALFYDRMALFDSFLSSMILWAVYFSLRTSRTLAKKDASLWGIFLGLAFLAKLNALLLLFLTPVCFLLCMPWKQIRKHWQKVLLLLLIALGISQAFRYSLVVSHGFHEYTTKSVTRYALPFSTLLTHPFQVFPYNIVHYTSWFITFVTLPVFLLGIIGLVLLLRKKPRTGIVMVLLWTAPIIATSFVSIVTVPRYILFVLPYFLIGVSFAAAQLLQRKLFVFVLAALLVFPIAVDVALLVYPPYAPLPAVEDEQYISGLPSGYGLEKVFTFLRNVSKSKNITVVTLGTVSSYPFAFNLEFWNDPHVTVTAIWPVEKDSQKKIAALAKTANVYVVLKFNAYQEHTNFLKELHLREILSSDKPNRNNPILLAVPQR